MKAVVLEVRSLEDVLDDTLQAAKAARRTHEAREAARRVGRDVKAVHGDVTALAAARVVVRDRRGRVEFPFDAVKVEFVLQAASVLDRELAGLK